MSASNGDGPRDDLFYKLYRRYYPRMLRFFRSVFRVSQEDAEDLAQDAFIRFYRAMDEYRGDAEWALLEKIARNVALNRIRSLETIRRGAVRTESLDDPAIAEGVKAAGSDDALQRVIDGERRTRLRQAIAALPRGQRQCLQFWLEGFKYEEISVALGVSLDAVRSRIRDAKRTLREKLGAEGELPEDES